LIDKNLQLDCQRIYLRRLLLKDAVSIYPQVDDQELVRWTTRIPHPYPPGGAEKFIRQSQRQWLKQTAYVFAVIKKDPKNLIGIISLSNVFLKHGCAEMGFWLGRNYWNQGFMTEAAQVVVRFAFNQLDLYRIYASTFEANAASRKVLEKCGFQLEGTMREAVVREGKRQNFLNYGLLKPEFELSNNYQNISFNGNAY